MLHWSREEDGRFYTAFMCQDLLHDWVVVKAWGGKGKPKSNQLIIACTNKDEAIEVMASITRKRQKRGYKLINLDSLDGHFQFCSANCESQAMVN